MKTYLLAYDTRILDCTIDDISSIQSGYTLFRELKEGESNFAPRYEIKDDTIVDAYPGKTDEEVLTLIEAETAAETARLEALATPL